MADLDQIRRMQGELKKSYTQRTPAQMQDDLRRLGAGELPDSSIPVKQEMHPDLTFGDRFVIKNFGTDPESTTKFLKQRHGDNLLVTHKGGQVLVRRPDEQQWSVLDPEGFDLQDITDVGYDVASGIGSGAATAAAGLGAGAATGGFGAKIGRAHV